uniref:Uncharacterized protein n=1 Tax=Tanacetum cinerariifolium TaxID=118510 RepID=A0A699GKQ8_TANCI|nr:hypothetical protein [Tanacetum cinerariifolium]
MTSFGYRLNPRYAIKECSSCGALYTGDFCCSKGNVEDKILVSKLPKNCASANVVNAPREPFVVKKDHSVNSSQNPPHIDECCYECGDALDGIFCQQCTFPFINPEPGYSQDFNFPKDIHDFQQQYLCCDQCGGPYETLQCQQSPVIHLPPQETSIKILHDQETFLRKFNRYSFFKMPKVLLLAWDKIFKIKDALGNKQYKPNDTQELFHELFYDVQNIHEELAEYINTSGWNRPAFYENNDDDDVDYTIDITPVLSTEEPDNSLSMGDEHLDTILVTKSDEVIKSSVEDLVSIPSESEGILDTRCDVHLVKIPTPLEAKDHFKIVINSNDDISSSDDDTLYYENIEYVEASSYDSELVSLEVAKIVISKDEEIEDDNLREKLLNVHLLIANIEALKDNPTPSSEFLTKSSSTSPKPFLEETKTFDNSLPEFENFCFDLSDFTHEEFADELAHIISPPEYDCFYFRNFPDLRELISILNSEIHENLSSTTHVNLPVKDDHSHF